MTLRSFRSPFPDVSVPNLSLTDVVLGGAEAYRDRPALVDGTSGRVLTFGDLCEQVRRVAAGLSSRVGKGDVVAIWAPNVPEYAVVFHAVARLGSILTTVNPAYTVEEVAFQLQDADAKLLVTTAALADRARDAVAMATRSVEIITIDSAPGVPSLASIAVDADPPPVAIDPATDVVALPYSSGTTGLPKGVMLTHRNLVANLVQIDAIEARDIRALAGVLPFFHIYGMVVIMNFGLMRGATIVTLARFELEPFLRVLQEWPIALVHVAPPIVVALAKHPVVDSYNLSGVKWLFSAAAPLGAELTSAVEARLSVRVRQGYGMTEASPATHYTVPGGEQSGKVGPLVPSTECRMVDPETKADVGVGQPGEVWVRGPQVMKGYLGNPDATALTIDADGWLHTGDIGIVSEDGYLEVVDRLKELIKVKGYQVAPAELEALLLKHPKIADAAVIPVPDEEAGQRPKAIIVAREGLTAEEVTTFVEAHVAHYKRIWQVAFVESIPKSPSGKILRRVLVEQERLKPVSRGYIMSFNLATYTFVHVVLSLVGIGSGFVVLLGLFTRKRFDASTAVFLASTAATSVTGFGFPSDHLLPSHVVGAISLVVLALAIFARYTRHLAGAWRRVYVVGAVVALYLNVFVLIVQGFLKVPALNAAAPTQSEPPFLVAQFVAMALFVAFGTVAAKRFTVR